uniref:WGS project CAEQ00000000 data, annotated contig 1227 n=1 Tax=Trypanosoma congolense (strain IL3000) TaxID=1068625 RepID=F9W4T6_TRYCI|nr:unnamed protein product [Trypanosoma congolense IL3000]
MHVFFYFSLGWVVGSVGVVLCLLLGVEYPASIASFNNIVVGLLIRGFTALDTSSICRVVRRRKFEEYVFGFPSLHTDKPGDEERVPITMGKQRKGYVTGSSVLPERLSVMCQLSICVEGEVNRLVRSCRLVLLETCMMMYEVLSSRSVGSHERAVTEERFICRIWLNDVISRAIFVNASDKDFPCTGGLHGHMLMITGRSGGVIPLFERQGEKFFCGNDGLFEPRKTGEGKEKSHKGSTWDLFWIGKENTGEQLRRLDSAESVSRTEEDPPFKLSTPGEQLYDEGSSTCGRNLGGAEPSQSGIFLKFHYAREQERVQNLLTGMHEAMHWYSYLQTIPTPSAFNILFSRFVFQSMRSKALADLIREKLQKSLDKFSSTKFPRDLEGRILLDDITLTCDVPVISNVTGPFVLAKGEFMFDLDLFYRGGASLTFRCCLTYRDTRIPHIVLNLKIVRLSAKLRVSVGPPPTKVFWVGCHAPPDVQLEVSQGLAANCGLLHCLLQKLPDLSGIVRNLVKLYVASEMMLPRMDDFPLPDVEDTPPVSPLACKKRWDVPFHRKEASRRSRERVDMQQPWDIRGRQ